MRTLYMLYEAQLTVIMIYLFLFTMIYLFLKDNLFMIILLMTIFLQLVILI